jgi:hypothetical protein
MVIFFAILVLGFVSTCIWFVRRIDYVNNLHYDMKEFVLEDYSKSMFIAQNFTNHTEADVRVVQKIAEKTAERHSWLMRQKLPPQMIWSLSKTENLLVGPEEQKQQFLQYRKNKIKLSKTK